ncbi:unnamed protein product [Symbiodinium necroappetens]|uniref:Uncharacterized protein n=1 Tax=Symbiodinium necroappetens TaxID=1628268 RepID=A0A812RH44_9DINO|nr:unnamed protein product [Symbiodinium necroappetens]
MLRFKEIEAVLAKALTDGVANIMITDEGGGVIASARPKQVESSGVAVISSAVGEFKLAAEYISPDMAPTFEDALFTCDNAMVACTTFLCPGCCCLTPYRSEANELPLEMSLLGAGILRFSCNLETFNQSLAW